mmetsp:Transcript_119194/g.379969  ORF Transcript_119194/g.379969 Transcript_119194/m.379969 type:complete len:203 (-) Transcript_119194:1274-1882(-)
MGTKLHCQTSRGAPCATNIWWGSKSSTNPVGSPCSLEGPPIEGRSPAQHRRPQEVAVVAGEVALGPDAGHRPHVRIWCAERSRSPHRAHILGRGREHRRHGLLGEPRSRVEDQRREVALERLLQGLALALLVPLVATFREQVAQERPQLLDVLLGDLLRDRLRGGQQRHIVQRVFHPALVRRGDAEQNAGREKDANGGGREG